MHLVGVKNHFEELRKAINPFLRKYINGQILLYSFRDLRTSAFGSVIVGSQ